MSKLLIPIIITLLSLVGNNCFAQYGEGDGTEGNPYQISTKAHLIALGDSVNNGTRTYSGVYFKMMNDIDISESFTPIGNAINSFQGIFDGNGYEIRMGNFPISTGNRVGLFGYTLDASILNVSMDVDSILYTSNNLENTVVGFLIANAENTTITSCSVGDSTTISLNDLKKNNFIGGMIGHAVNCTVSLSNSYSTIYLTSTGDNNGNYIGGLIGQADNCYINNCYSRNNIYTDTEQNNAYMGGFIGLATNTSISNSYSAPTSFTTDYPFAGVIAADSSGTTTFNNCYYLISDSIKFGPNVDTTTVGTGLTIDQMYDDSFIDSLNQGQDSIIWVTGDDGLPSSIGYKVVWIRPYDGNGTIDDPFRVRYVEDLIFLSNLVKLRSLAPYYLRMENDICFNNGKIDSSALFTPIGNKRTNKGFSGNFNGNGFSISNYNYSNPDSNNIAIFSYLNGATIIRLGISNININAGDTIGAIAALVENNTLIDSCFVYGFIKGKNNVGGIIGVGANDNAKINSSFSNVSIDAQTNVGGIAGNFTGRMTNVYSNSEIYSSSSANDYVGGIIGLAKDTSNLTNVYSASKIIRYGTNTNFGKIKGNNLGINTNCYSRDSVFVNYTNSNTTGYNGTSLNNAALRNPTFATSTLGSAIWKIDYADRINDGYPIFTYQPQAVKPDLSGSWPTTTASQVVIIKSGVQLKADTTNFPKCAYVKIENGGELNNTTNIKLFGEFNRELYVGKWNLIGLSTYNKILSCLYNYTDSISFKTFVKRFNYTTNNWSINTIDAINTQFNYGEGILVMPNYSLDSRLLTKSKIVSKGVLFNDTTYQVTNPTTASARFVSLANNYPASLDTALLINKNSSLIQGRLIYVYDADTGKWNNNLNTNVQVTSIKPGEGFFVAASNTGGNFQFNKNLIKNTSGAKNSIKSDLIYVQAIANNNIRESFLEFNEEADNEFDFEDGLMLFGNNNNSVEPFFTIPTPEINDSTTQLIKDAFSTLPYTNSLNLRSYDDNDVRISFSNIPDYLHIYLIDSLLNKISYMNESHEYMARVKSGDNSNRLFVYVSHYEIDMNKFFSSVKDSEIRVWNYNNTLNIKGKDLVKYEIYDIIGNKVFEGEINCDDFQTKLSLSKGIYVVRAYSKTGSKTSKLSLNNDF